MIGERLHARRKEFRWLTMTVANLVTILRVLLVPVIAVAMVEGLYALAFWLFIVAGLSDAVDGAIARIFDQRSDLGAMLDPLADKALLVTVFLMLGMSGALPVWLVILVVSRDIVIIAGVWLADFLGTPMQVRPHPISKVNTAAQILLAVFALATLAWTLGIEPWLEIGVYATAVLTVSSLATYTWIWVSHVHGHSEARN